MENQENNKKQETKYEIRRRLDHERGWKICKKCSTQKDLTEFHMDKRFNIHRTICKDCNTKRTKVWRSKNREKVNREQKIYKKKRRQTLKYVSKLESASSKRTYLKYKNKIKLRTKKCNQRPDVKERTRQVRQKYYHSVLKHNPKAKIKRALRGRIKCVLKRDNNKKLEKTEKLIGCSYEEFVLHIESQFTKGMSWSSYGNTRKNWVIDHILPCELFNLSNLEEQRICFHYTNHRPLWWQENNEKLDFLDDGRQARKLTQLEKLQYLKSKGFDLFYLYPSLRDTDNQSNLACAQTPPEHLNIQVSLDTTREIFL